MADDIKKTDSGKTELRCNCNDPYRTEVCPIHCKEKPDMAKIRGDMASVVGDQHLIPDEIGQWMGYAFKCPKCGKPAIMDFMHFCGNCGARILIQSKKVTEFINQLQESYNNGK